MFKYYLSNIIKDPKIFYKYLSYIVRHKYYVFIECVKYSIPLQGLIHDWHKFLPSEFFPYMMHFYGDIKTGKDKTGYFKPTDTGDPAFDFAWLLHQKRARHHWQWWILPENGGGQKILEMPIRYRKEMVADWKGAGMAQGKPNTLEWYSVNQHRMTLAPETRKWINNELGYKAEQKDYIEIDDPHTKILEKIPAYSA